MTWNDLVSGVRDKLRRLTSSDGHQIEMSARPPRPEQLGSAPLATPPVDVYENDKEILIAIDVPGGTPDGALVAWDEARGLTLLVKNQPLPEGSARDCEYQPHSWFRAFELPEYVDGQRASSSLKDGVLTIRIPKRAAVARLIPVKAA